jgi:hypothetical protein
MNELNPLILQGASKPFSSAVKRRKRSAINRSLIEAAQQGDIGGIRAALTEGATNMRVALKEAMEAGQVAALAYLIDARPVDASRLAGLLSAAQSQARQSLPQGREILLLLLSRVERERVDPAYWGGWISREIAGGIDLELCRAYLDAGFDAREFDDRPLLTAWHCKREDIAALLIERGANPQTARPNWELCQAIERGDLESVIHWLNAGAAASFDGECSLFLALERSGSVEIVRLLVERGARPTGRFADFLSAAAESGRLENVRLLVEEQGVCPRAHGAKALSEAAWMGALDILRFLLDRGAPPQSQEANALNSAIEASQWEATRFLLARGARPDYVPEGYARLDGEGIILGPAEAGQWDIVRLMIERGADPRPLEGREMPEEIALLCRRWREAREAAENDSNPSPFPTHP